MAHLEKRISLRLPENWLPEIRQAMARKGTVNLGDFVRQAVCAEIKRTTAIHTQNAVNFATAQATQEQETGT
jgi:metal-responsive CopG/Arc/MetJ family transcriptional regulator